MVELTGYGIVMNETRPEDLDIALHLESENAAFICPSSHKQHLAMMVDPDRAHLAIRTDFISEPVGFVILQGLSDPQKPLEFRRIVVGEHGKGYGRKAVRLVKQFAFGTLKRHRLWLDVFTHNTRAIRLYESEGFVYEGTLREAVRKGDEWMSLRVYSLLAEEYLA